MDPIQAVKPLEQQFENPPKKYPSYLDTNELSSRARIVCEMLARVYPGEVETGLSTLGMNLEPEVVEEIIKFSYGYPETVVMFFKWVGSRQKHSPLMWNLIVDLLGKNKMFDQMWEAIRSMKQEGVLSLTTFVSVFGSYCEVGKFSEAVMTFDLMKIYGVEPDVVAVNSLLSAICRDETQTAKAYEFFEKVKTRISPDGDTYAILFEGWEKERDVARAKTLFGEMVVNVGWSSKYTSAYDAFLTTLVNASQIDEALNFLQVMKGKKCLPGLKFFSNALDSLVQKNDSVNALSLWDTMMTGELTPTLTMYNTMISLLCNNDEIANAFQLLDNMPYRGVFADSVTYNVVFRCLIKNKKVKEAGKFFTEMIKNEQPPTPANCADAMSLFFDHDDPEMAYEVWAYVKEEGVTPVEDSANALLVGLASLGRLSEFRRNFEKFLKGTVKIYESTMEKLKIACQREGKKACELYDDLDRKWRYS
ncbi:putative tetratricopeptide-like helical domain superfamily, pentacotripeptide-repeat region of PRORP [Helianthus annuus]|nr:putative tetratricopeptide-like helical domain superfamily, pentacotripeptide-repeat region of PRORP [Helianthus annuus]KAJ0937012.1 putative tetratricopeptide-like helical domain superfamily, pentacotripeptide-repeat region of PRORP [Helianthus annuus]